MEPSRRIDALTGLRPFASLYVFFFHFGRSLVPGWPAPLRSLASSGYVAVSFFYVLSGFVLATRYGPRAARDAFDVRRFWARRLARLGPAYLLALALLVPLARRGDLGVRTSVLGGLLQLTMLQACWPPVALTWNLPAWSISIEVAFYLLLPWLLARLVHASPRRRWLVAGACWLGSLALTGGYSLVRPDGVVGPDSDAWFLSFLKLWPPVRLPELTFGLALGLVFDRQRASARGPRWLGALALAVIVATLAFAERLPFAMLHDALLMPAFGALVWATAAARGPLARLLSTRPLQRLGLASYDVYILQMPLMYLVLATRWPLAGWRFMLVFGALVWSVALAFHLVVEPPAQRWLQARLGDRGQRRPGRFSLEHASSVIDQ